MLRRWAHLRSKLGCLLVDIGACIGRSHEELGGEVVELSNTAGLRADNYSQLMSKAGRKFNQTRRDHEPSH